MVRLRPNMALSDSILSLRRNEMNANRVSAMEEVGPFQGPAQLLLLSVGVAHGYVSAPFQGAGHGWSRLKPCPDTLTSAHTQLHMSPCLEVPNPKPRFYRYVVVAAATAANSWSSRAATAFPRYCRRGCTLASRSTRIRGSNSPRRRGIRAAEPFLRSRSCFPPCALEAGRGDRPGREYARHGRSRDGPARCRANHSQPSSSNR